MALTDGLVGHWCPSLDDAGNGTATLTDLSGNGNHGTLTNMDPATDWVADTSNGGVRALDFDGVNDYVETAFNLTSTPFSGSVWLSTTGTVGWITSIHKTDFNKGWIVPLNANELNFYSSSSPHRTIGANANNGSWKFFSWTINNAGDLDLYIDGIKNNSYSLVTVALESVGMKIGGSTATFSDNFTGKLDDIRIYNRILTASETSLLASQRGYQESTGQQSPIQSRAIGRLGPLRGIVR